MKSESSFATIVLSLLRRVSILDGRSHFWSGTRWQPDLLHELPDSAVRDAQIDELVRRLYREFYLSGAFSTDAAALDIQRRDESSHDFVRQLSTANSGSGTLQQGWTLVDCEPLTIRREGLTLRAEPDEIVSSKSGAPEAGDRVQLKLPKELPAISPGFYMALSDAPFEAGARPVVRFYWNLYPWGAAPLTREITGQLNGAGLPFRLKLINHPNRYNRCDTAVLYLPKEELEAAVPLLSGIYADICRDLKRPVPALTKRVAPGLGFAEDPPDGESFGMNRCRLLAGGLVRGWEQSANTIETRLEAMFETFRESGIDPERPYLNPGSHDAYDFTFDAPESRPNARVTDGDAYLEVASAIGREICREAFWHDGWCNWLGAEPRNPATSPHQGIAYASLGPDPYAGSSGVALFLAELATETGDDVARSTALGAIRQALGRAESIDAPVRLGLYTGLSGLALLATRIGTLLDAGDVRSDALALLDGLQGDRLAEREHDLQSGVAGGIVALLGLAGTSGERRLVELATSLGDRLVAAAECHGEGCSWSSPGRPGSPNLTGLAHGAAGIGMALLELWNATGDRRYYEVAARAFDFERHWFNPETGNWPDFRTVDSLSSRPDGQFPYPAAWCHGAPGIALSRLRAWELTGEPCYREEAILALETTRRTVVHALEAGTQNFSLCHGLSGNAEILTLGAEILGEEFRDLSTPAREVAAAGIALYAPEGRKWPGGTGAGWTPNLMLGLSGIGHFYLRMANPRIPSVLLPRDFS